MSNIIPFDFQSNQIRVIEKDGEPWFVAKDVCLALGYSKYRDAISKHIDQDERVSIRVDTLRGFQEMTCVNESGVYALVFSSQKSEAKQFRRWVTSEVLPSIRKNGGYISGQEQDEDPELIMAKALQLAQRVIEDKSQALEQAQKTIESQKPAVDFVEKYTKSVNGSLGFREACKLFNVKEYWMRQFLQDRKIMYRLSGDWVPYQNHIDAGRFSIKLGVASHNDHAYKSTKFTPKGIKWLAGLIYEQQLSDQADQEQHGLGV